AFGRFEDRLLGPLHAAQGGPAHPPAPPRRDDGRAVDVGALLSVKDITADDFKSITFPVSGGEPLPLTLQEEYLTRLNMQLLEGYGLTETSPVASWST